MTYATPQEIAEQGNSAVRQILEQHTNGKALRAFDRATSELQLQLQLLACLHVSAALGSCTLGASSTETERRRGWRWAPVNGDPPWLDEGRALEWFA